MQYIVLLFFKILCIFLIISQIIFLNIIAVARKLKKSGKHLLSNPPKELHFIKCGFRIIEIIDEIMYFSSLAKDFSRIFALFNIITFLLHIMLAFVK